MCALSHFSLNPFTLFLLKRSQQICVCTFNRPLPYSPITLFTHYLIHPLPYSPFTLFTLYLIHPLPYSTFTLFNLYLIHPLPYSTFTLFILYLIHPLPYSPFTLFNLYLIHPLPYSSFTLFTLYLIHPLPYSQQICACTFNHPLPYFLAVVAYGSVVTLKNRRGGGGLLHSHAHLYPEEEGKYQQQQVSPEGVEGRGVD